MVNKEERRKCCKCGRSPAVDNVKLFRFPKPSLRNILRCTLWTKFMFPSEEQYTSIALQTKLNTEHRMVCDKHFLDSDFADETKQKLLRTSVPSVVHSLSKKISNEPSTSTGTSQQNEPGTSTSSLDTGQSSTSKDGTKGCAEKPVASQPAPRIDLNESADSLSEFLNLKRRTQIPSPQLGELFATGVDAQQTDQEPIRSPSPDDAQGSEKAEEIEVEIEPQVDEKVPFKICRICLVTNRKLYHIIEHNMDKMFEAVTGIVACEDIRWPQYLCWECSTRLSQAHTLKNKAQTTQKLLNKLLNKGIEGDQISIVDIQSINRQKHKLETCLTTCVIEEVIENLEYRLQIRDLKTEDEIKQEKEDEDNQEVPCDGQEDVGSNIEANALQLPVVEYLEEDLNEVLEYVLPAVGITDMTVKPDSKQEIEEERDSKITIQDVRKALKELKSKQQSKRNVVLEAVESLKTFQMKRIQEVNDPLSELFAITPLTYEGQLEEVDKRKESEQYLNATYKCDVCYRGYKDLAAYNAHNVHHSDSRGVLECPICKRRSKTPRTLRTHLKSAHTVQYNCKQCKYTTRHRHGAVSHRAWHDGKRFICEHCGKEFQRSTTYMTHLRLWHATDFICQLCGYTFINAHGFKMHRSNIHNLKPHDTITVNGPVCDVCNVQFASENALQTHIVMSSNHKDDPRRLEIMTERRKHLGIVTKRELKKFECELCGIEIKGVKPYAAHFKSVHPGKRPTKLPPQKPRMCDLCGKIFKSALLLKYHMNKHLGVTFTCKMCGKVFKCQSNLYTHVKFHHRGVPRPKVPCSVCGKYFSGRCNLNKHMLRHTGLRNYPCSLCEKTFVTPDETRAHLLHFHLKKPWPKRNRVRTKRKEISIEDNTPEMASTWDTTALRDVPVTSKTVQGQIRPEDHTMEIKKPKIQSTWDGTYLRDVPITPMEVAITSRDVPDTSRCVPIATRNVPSTSGQIRPKRISDGTLRIDESNTRVEEMFSASKLEWDCGLFTDLPRNTEDMNASRLERALNRITHNFEVPSTGFHEICNPKTTSSAPLKDIAIQASADTQTEPKKRTKTIIPTAGPSKLDLTLPRSGKKMSITTPGVIKPIKTPMKKIIAPISGLGESSKPKTRDRVPHSGEGSKTPTKTSQHRMPRSSEGSNSPTKRSRDRNIPQKVSVEVLQQPSSWNIPPSFEDYEF